MRADDDSFSITGKTTRTGRRRTSLESRSLKYVLGTIILLLRFVLYLNISSAFTSSFLQTAKIGSLVDIQDSEDPEGLRVFYYLVQDLKVTAQNEFEYSFSPLPCSA
jgi:hypothetical protein